MHIDNKIGDISTLGEIPTQGLDDTILTSETKYLINFIQSRKGFAFSLLYNGSSSFIFVNTAKIYQFKAWKDHITKDYKRLI